MPIEADFHAGVGRAAFRLGRFDHMQRHGDVAVTVRHVPSQHAHVVLFPSHLDGCAAREHREWLFWRLIEGLDPFGGRQQYRHAAATTIVRWSGPSTPRGAQVMALLAQVLQGPAVERGHVPGQVFSA